MQVKVFDSKQEMGKAAADQGADLIGRKIADTGSASIILATGASQFEMLENLTAADLDWSRVDCFHLDEYVGLSIDHPASFRKYLKERFIDQLPQAPASFHLIDGEGDAQAECNRLGQLIEKTDIDVAFVGIGENGHLAFNDPPADFETDVPYLVVELDDACRQQQYGEGWFETLDSVPKTAISMSVTQILKSQNIICTVPDERKSEAVGKAVEGPVTPEVPASILQQHKATTLFLDRPAASRLS